MRHCLQIFLVKIMVYSWFSLTSLWLSSPWLCLESGYFALKRICITIIMLFFVVLLQSITQLWFPRRIYLPVNFSIQVGTFCRYWSWEFKSYNNWFYRLNLWICQLWATAMPLFSPEGSPWFQESERGRFFLL